MPNIADSFPSKYLKAGDLKGRSVVVVMDRVEFEPVGQDKQMKPILYFRGKDKGLVLNKTNANKITQLTSSPVTEDWRGCSVLIYPTETTFGSDVVDCIRVKAAPVRSKAAPVVVEPEPEQDYEPLTDEEIPF